MNRSVRLALIGVGIVAGLASVPARSAWRDRLKPFTPRGVPARESYTVDMPGTPTQRTEAVPLGDRTVTAYLHVGEDRKGAYAVAAYTLPRDLREAGEEVLDALARTSIEAAQPPRSASPIRDEGLAGLPGRAYDFEATFQGRRVQGRIQFVIKEDVVFVLEALGAPLDASRVARFFGSFRPR
ncbi:MAG: hypothetical protein M9894_12295 [Planctomycetes bacterium]|nr:hypothetical protein [Planctomycetota bacterium]